MPEQPIGGKCTLATDCQGWGHGIGGRGVICYGGECGEPGPRKENETCNLHEDCSGYGLGLNDMACCSWRCKEKINGACPGEFGNAGASLGESCTLATDCQGWGHGIGGEGVMCKGGVCAKPGPEEIGGPCNLNEDCAGYGPGETATACCGFKCAKKINSWCPGEGGNAGAEIGGSCNVPEDCKNWGWLIGGKGTQCLNNVCTPAGPQPEGGPCNVGLDCAGYDGLSETGMACCDRKCTRKINSWCPGEGANAGAPIGGACRGNTDCQMWGPGVGGKGVVCYGGTCDYPGERELGETCNLHEDCKGFATSSIPNPVVAAVTSGIEGTCCSKNVCKQKVDGWCPDDPYKKLAEDTGKFVGDTLGDIGGGLIGGGGVFGKIKRYLIIGGVVVGLFAIIGITLKVGYTMGMSKKVMGIVGGIMFLVAVAIIAVVIFATKEEETYRRRRVMRRSSKPITEKKPLMTTWLDLNPTNTMSKRPNFDTENVL